MITPTGMTVAQYSNAIKSGNLQHIRATFIDKNIVLTDNDIEASGLQYECFLNGDVDLIFGRAIMSQIELSILPPSEDRPSVYYTDEMKLELGIEVSGTTNWITIGYFIGDTPQKMSLREVVRYTGYDRMKLFEVPARPFMESITYPTTVADIYHALCEYVGVEYEAGNELSNIMSRSYTTAPFTITEGYTCRNILAWIAEAAGCYAKITNTGKCKLVWYTDQTSYGVIPDEEYNASGMDSLADGKTWAELRQLTWGQIKGETWMSIAGYETMFKVTALCVKTTEDDVGVIVSDGSDYNTYLIVDNPFLYHSNDTEVQNYINPLYDRLKAFGSYLPMTIECVGNWLVEAGDIITVAFNGSTYNLPIFCKSYNWNGSCVDTYQATGQTKRTPVSHENQQKLRNGARFHEFIVDIDSLKSRIGDAEGNISTLEQTATNIILGVTPVGAVDTVGSYIQIGTDTIDINSGGDIDIHSGGEINIESGGDLNVGAGGDINVNANGGITVNTNGSITIDGGSLDITSGSINITSDGALTVTGGSVSISSGGEFNVYSTNFTLDSSLKIIDIETTNFKIDSVNKTLQAGNWSFYNGGISWIDDTVQSFSLSEFHISRDGNDIIFYGGRKGESFFTGMQLSSGDLLPYRSSSMINFSDLGKTDYRWHYGYIDYLVITNSIQLNGKNFINRTTEINGTVTTETTPPITYTKFTVPEAGSYLVYAYGSASTNSYVLFQMYYNGSARVSFNRTLLKGSSISNIIGGIDDDEVWISGSESVPNITLFKIR